MATRGSGDGSRRGSGDGSRRGSGDGSRGGSGDGSLQASGDGSRGGSGERSTPMQSRLLHGSLLRTGHSTPQRSVPSMSFTNINVPQRDRAMLLNSVNDATPTNLGKRPMKVQQTYLRSNNNSMLGIGLTRSSPITIDGSEDESPMEKIESSKKQRRLTIREYFKSLQPVTSSGISMCMSGRNKMKDALLSTGQVNVLRPIAHTPIPNSFTESSAIRMAATTHVPKTQATPTHKQVLQPTTHTPVPNNLTRVTQPLPKTSGKRRVATFQPEPVFEPPYAFQPPVDIVPPSEVSSWEMKRRLQIPQGVSLVVSKASVVGRIHSRFGEDGLPLLPRGMRNHMVPVEDPRRPFDF